jgi:dihydrofolate reductase
MSEMTLPRCSVFCGMSLDGFIARADGNLDFLDAPGNDGASNSDDSYDRFIADIDTLVWGRKTFEKIMSFDKWYHGEKRVIILSSQPIDLKPARDRGGNVGQMSGSPLEIVTKLGQSGSRHIYVDGGVTVQAFLKAGLVSRMIISQLPVLIGQGLPLFGPLEKDIRLKLTSSKAFPGGMVQMEYQVHA